ncbi:MAG TPA: basic secretory protein-like protein [Armatimonadota bacterium]|nr:basic secretory protein-like protein [Armatimonadota bacterium]
MKKWFSTVCLLLTAGLLTPFVPRARAADAPQTEELPAPASVEPMTPYLDVTLDYSAAPDMKAWAENAVKVVQGWYPKIALLLPSPGYTPPTHVTIILRKDINVPAETGGGQMSLSVSWFKAHPDDVGALVHESVHVVQSYHSRGNPGWLVEGIADYIRWQLYEPVPLPGPLNPDRVTYHDAYRTTAAFLAFVTDTHGVDVVTPLNAAMREGRYKESLWKDLTGETLPQLGADWIAALRARPKTVRKPGG